MWVEIHVEAGPKRDLNSLVTYNLRESLDDHTQIDF
jgi:hypothetical protein